MPLYEYICPQCEEKFETMRAMGWRHFAPCPHCNGKSKLLFSMFNIYNLNWTQTDGEGFTSKWVRKEELAEMNKECRER